LANLTTIVSQATFLANSEATYVRKAFINDGLP